MGAEDRTDALIAGIARHSHGVVTRAGLLDAGVTRREIAVRVARGSLIRVHRGVFRVGHAAPGTLARYAAAVLACGDGAALAGLAAAHLHRITKVPPSVISVLTPTERRVPGLATQRSRVFGEEEVALVRGIRVTSVPRTLVDLASLLSPGDLARACHEAHVLYATTPADVDAVLARRPNATGAASVRRAMGGGEVTLSRLETRFVGLLRSERMPLPETNRKAGGRFVDCRWPTRRLTVELDSFTFHNSRHSWERDREREREAYARGDQLRRYTWRDVTETPARMLRELRELLS